MKKIYILITSVLAYSATFAQNIGIGTTTPQSKLSIGASSQFQIDSVGNTKRINNIPIAFPSVQASNKQTIINDGEGNLSWGYGLIPSGGIILSTTLDSNIINAGFTLIGMKIDSIQPVSVNSAQIWSGSISTLGAPSARRSHSAIWTGTEMIVWGGESVYSGGNSLGDGYRYNPITNIWSPISSIGAPTARETHTAIWTGTEMIIWGGINAQTNTQYNNGAKYNPSTNTWSAISSIGAPGARVQHSAVWTGTEMIIWGGGGSGYKSDGGRYNPSTNTWTTMTNTGAPAARSGHSAIWTGTEMIVWGGYNSGPFPFNEGKRYNPSTNTWGATISLINAPSVRGAHVGVWTGTEMIIWGGNSISSFYNDGYKYNVSSNTWSTTPITLTNAPSVRANSTGIWTGTEMIIWGGNNASATLNNGGRLTSGAGSGSSSAITYYYYRKN